MSAWGYKFVVLFCDAPMSVINPGVAVRGMGMLMWVLSVWTHISWCLTYDVTAVPWLGLRLHSSEICSSLCKVTEYWNHYTIVSTCICKHIGRSISCIQKFDQQIGKTKTVFKWQFFNCYACIKEITFFYWKTEQACIFCDSPKTIEKLFWYPLEKNGSFFLTQSSYQICLFVPRQETVGHPWIW